MLKRPGNSVKPTLKERDPVGKWSRATSSVKFRVWKISQTLLQKYRQYVLRPFRPFPNKRGILFIGYVQAGLGLGESLRGMIKAAAHRGLKFGVYPYRVGVETRIIGEFMPERYDRQHRYDFNMIEVAADQVPALFRTVDPRHIAGSYNILRTYWELAKAPREWEPMLDRIDEIWVPNQFVHDAFRRIFAGPITIIPPCVVIEDTEYPDRVALGLESNRFYFLFSFDYYSSPHRKNPLGVLAAFLAAFPHHNENVGLVIKSTGSEMHHPDIKEKIRIAAEADPRIQLIDKTLSRKEVLGLIRACDCYVSLHRAEGFGLGMVEAMSFGKIVIGTDYSGSTDFLSEDTGYPVAYNLIPVEPNEYTWSSDQVWAEPDLEAAVKAFKLAFSDRDSSRRKAAAGKMLVDRKYGVASVGAEIERRIDELELGRA